MQTAWVQSKIYEYMYQVFLLCQFLNMIHKNLSTSTRKSYLKPISPITVKLYDSTFKDLLGKYNKNSSRKRKLVRPKSVDLWIPTHGAAKLGKSSKREIWATSCESNERNLIKGEDEYKSNEGLSEIDADEFIWGDRERVKRWMKSRYFYF